MNPVQGYFPLGAGLPAHFVAFVWRVFVHLMCSKSPQKFLMHLHLASGGVIDRFPPPLSHSSYSLFYYGYVFYILDLDFP